MWKYVWLSLGCLSGCAVEGPTGSDFKPRPLTGDLSVDIGGTWEQRGQSPDQTLQFTSDHAFLVVTTGEQGTWSIDHTTLTMAFSDGRTVSGEIFVTEIKLGPPQEVTYPATLPPLTPMNAAYARVDWNDDPAATRAP